MIIQCDSREQKNKEVLDHFKAVGQKFFTCKVHAGDYIDFSCPRVSIDLKANLEEVAQNLTKDHMRFKAEIARCKYEMRCDFVVLIREPLKSLEEVKQWNSTRTKMKGETLYKIMKTFEQRYNVVWRFCSREEAGAKIIQYLQWWHDHR